MAWKTALEGEGGGSLGAEGGGALLLWLSATLRRAKKGVPNLRRANKGVPNLPPGPFQGQNNSVKVSRISDLLFSVARSQNGRCTDRAQVCNQNAIGMQWCGVILRSLCACGYDQCLHCVCVVAC